jgi:hypothetical protein
MFTIMNIQEAIFSSGPARVQRADGILIICILKFYVKNMSGD